MRYLRGQENIHSVNTGLVNGLVEGEDVDKIGSEGIFGRESDFDSLAVVIVSHRFGRRLQYPNDLRLDVFNDLNSGLLDELHALSVAVLAQEAGGSDNEIDTIDTALDGLLGVLHVTSDVGENLGLFWMSVHVSKRIDCQVRTLSPRLQMVLQSSYD